MFGSPPSVYVPCCSNLARRITCFFVHLRQHRTDAAASARAGGGRATVVLPLRVLEDCTLTASRSRHFHARSHGTGLAATEESGSKQLHYVAQTLADSTRTIGILNLEPILLLLHRTFDLLRHLSPELFGPHEQCVALQRWRPAYKYMRAREVRRNRRSMWLDDERDSGLAK